ncbi:flagellar M-ring protein FliF [Sphingorhabdus sp. IMCC26285]|uniref:Flagellar M-ring protein n=2 Tax=Sphingorhabdus profundilacus TaxID=2509718 RepID=A0A6I4M3E1_9SPHN|nr:flagellar M-ring protein FliF [Sphingorhabdus profundilacus]
MTRFATPATSGGFGALRDLTSQPAVRKALPALALSAAIGVAAISYFALATPAQAPLFQGLAESDKAAVADALQASGITYSLDPGTGAISVDAGKIHEARMLLAGQGLPKALPSGDAVIASLPMGSSRAVEGETLRGAREADLARTIEAIDAVKMARVHLAMPEPSVFVREAREPAASVMLTLQQGRSLSEAQVRAIRHLVASSVPGLAADSVSVIDQSGALISSPTGSADQEMFQLQMQMEERYRQAVVTLLTPIVGAENFSVEVHADIDPSETQSTRETFPKDDRALRSEEGNKTTQSANTPGAVGIPGALSNQPPPASQLTATPPGQTAQPNNGESQSEENYTRNFDVGREIAVTHQPQGNLRRLSVAVALRDVKGQKKPSAADVAALEALVKGAVGFSTERGDLVAISSRPFAEQEEAAVNFWDEPWFFPLVQQIGAVLAAILAFIFIGRPLMKAAKAKMAAAKEQAEVEQKLLAATGQPRPSNQVTIEMIEAAPSYETRANLVRSFIRQDPERAALVVRQMIQERANG